MTAMLRAGCGARFEPWDNARRQRMELSAKEVSASILSTAMRTPISRLGYRGGKYRVA